MMEQNPSGDPRRVDSLVDADKPDKAPPPPFDGRIDNQPISPAKVW